MKIKTVNPSKNLTETKFSNVSKTDLFKITLAITTVSLSILFGPYSWYTLGAFSLFGVTYFISRSPQHKQYPYKNFDYTYLKNKSIAISKEKKTSIPFEIDYSGVKELFQSNESEINSRDMNSTLQKSYGSFHARDLKKKTPYLGKMSIESPIILHQRLLPKRQKKQSIEQSNISIQTANHFWQNMNEHLSDSTKLLLSLNPVWGIYFLKPSIKV